MTRGDAEERGERLPAHFCRPRPDELLFSTLCRIRVRLDFSHRDFVTHLELSKWPAKWPAKGRNPFFPIATRQLIKLVPPELINHDELLRNHTLLPFLKPFVSSEYYKKVLDRTETRKTQLKLDKCVSNPDLQFCARCADEDQQTFGTPYLRQHHQLPGNIVCVKHRLHLTAIPPKDRHGYAFFNLNDLLKLPTSRAHKVSDRAITLANDLLSIPKVFDSMNATDVWSAIRWELGKIGKNVYNQSGRMKMQTGEAFLRFVGPLRKPLDLVAPDIRTLKHPRRLNRISAPALALLFIRFCGYTPESFVAEYNKSSAIRASFRPCLNPNCTGYKERLIPNARKHLKGTEYYLFECPRCHFTYLLTPMGITQRSARLVVYSLGAKQNAQFAEQWSDPNVSFDSIRKRFCITACAVFHLARFRGLTLDRGGLSIDRSAYRMVMGKIQRRSKRTEEAKKILLESLSRYPGYAFSKLICEADPKTRSAAIRLKHFAPEWVRSIFKAHVGRPPNTPPRSAPDARMPALRTRS
jgi:hypothetical protein